MSIDNEIPSAQDSFQEHGIVDAAQAARNLDLIRKRLGDNGMRTLQPFLHASLHHCADPDMALNNLERFLNGLPGERFLSVLQESHHLLTNLMTIFGASRFLSTFLLADPSQGMTLLADPLFARSADAVTLAGMLAEMRKNASDDSSFFHALRAFRKRELLRIALCDLLGRADLAETVNGLSNIAEVCVRAALDHADEELRSRYGRPMTLLADGTRPAAGFAVIAMGKLGGQELNFSSDIDLMYVYSADGETEGVGTEGHRTNRITNHQYFVKLAERLSAAIGQNTADGFVFRVDLRLRPEGQRGPLAQSLGGYEIYYESWGQTWERSALIKARFIAGDEAVGREFLERISPFVYRKYLDFSAIAEIREMKMKINREVKQKGRLERDVKLGYGGIREIEFLVQALQLIYGGRDRALRERSTMKALLLLAQKGLLTFQESGDLMKAYIFLRTVEHRLQMLNDLQTQTLPAGDAELRLLARRTGYFDHGAEARLLLHSYTVHTRKVRTTYDNLLSSAPEEPEEAQAEVAVLLDPATLEHDVIEFLSRSGFREPERACRNIALLREGKAFLHQTPRSRMAFTRLFPKLFREITASADPDMALNHLESFLASQGSWDAFQTFMGQDARLLNLLVSVFGNSDYFSRMLVRDPSLIEQLLDGTVGTGAAMQLTRSLAAAIDRAETITDKLDALRRFKHREELRIGMADLTGGIPLSTACKGLSRIADVCLTAALRLAAAETAKRLGGGSGAGLAVIGVGKLGGRELIYGSDLDILFVYDENLAGEPPPGMSAFELFSKIAERTISYLTTMTREGAAYRVDARLRPTGSKGPLAQSIEAFRSHFSGNAGTWERQALVNCRFVAGDREVWRGLGDAIRDAIYRSDDCTGLADEIRAMRKRMEEELGREDDRQLNIKQGAGGMVDIEFLVQYLQLCHGREKRRLQVPGTLNALHALRREGVIPSESVEALRRAYLFLRRIESRLRVVSNQTTSVVSRDPDRLTFLAKRLGFNDRGVPAGAQLLAECERVRTYVQRLYLHTVAGSAERIDP